MPRVTTPDGFWARVDRAPLTEPGGCWLWTGRTDSKGYGRVGFQGKHSQCAHRVAWLLTYGPIPDGLCVCHHCDNPPCVNPAHLFVGTQRENIADRHAKGRDNAAKPGSAHFRAKLTDDQVLAMRVCAAEGWTQHQLARQFGVSRGNVSKIVNRRTYANAA